MVNVTRTCFTLIFAMIASSLVQASDESKKQSRTIEFLLPLLENPRDSMVRDLSCYVADGITGTHDSNCNVRTDRSVLVEGIPESAIESLESAVNQNSNFFDLNLLQNWWNTWSYALRNRRGHEKLITDQISGFEAQTGYKEWTSEVVAFSWVKHKTRVIYRSPVEKAFFISVSETRDSETGDVTAPLIETEIAVERNDGSGNVDFYSYNADGQLSTTSRFPAGERPTPGVCLSCHHSSSSGKFERSGNSHQL